VYDELALIDAKAIYRFLQKRGYVGGKVLGPTPEVLRDASPLSGVDMVEVLLCSASNEM
jgi:predicted deacylase